MFSFVNPTTFFTFQNHLRNSLFWDSWPKRQMFRSLVYPGIPLARFENLLFFLSTNLAPSFTGEEVGVDIAVLGLLEVVVEFVHTLEYFPAPYTHNICDLLAAPFVGTLHRHCRRNLLCLVVRTTSSQIIPRFVGQYVNSYRLPYSVLGFKCH